MTDGNQKTGDELLSEYREKQTAFERQCWERWKPAFDLYDWVLLQTREAARFFLHHYWSQAVEQEDWMYEAQTRLQARAYRTACEVRALLLGGNPDGALARWRSIHEILVVMSFLQKYGAETAKRFLKYDLVQTAENWDRYDKLPPEWQTLSVTPEEAAQARDERAKILQEYGQSFRNENGWASAALGLTKDTSSVTSARLEEVVGLQPFRFYHHIASNHIHVNMKGLTNDFRADLIPLMDEFSPAAYTTLWGLAECTAIMVNLRPDPNTEEIIKKLYSRVAEAGQMFMRIQQQMMLDEKQA
ncbi:MAG TPA: DUF5677 domain-containing protein [Ktedonosporobacter sp.]|nr:DUF5677 domain-containing protein [Ktedonosporobacter sp.]